MILSGIKATLIRQYRNNPLVRLLFSGNKVYCPCCDSEFGWFLPHGVEFRRGVMCPQCGSLERHRLLFLYLKNKTNFLTAKLRVLDIGPEAVIQNICQNLPNLDYLSGDISDRPSMMYLDATDLPFPENTFDCIICYHIFEHVPDDKKAMSETFRVLKPGGWAVMEVPYDVNNEETVEDKSLKTSEERYKAYGNPDHYRVYGTKDYIRRLEEAGFTVKLDDYLAELSSEERDRFRLPEIEPLHVCRKII